MTKKGGGIRDLLVSILFILGAAFCFMMFWRDFNRTMDHSGRPLGTITYKKQAAGRRFQDRVLWVRLFRGAPVHRGDYIRTAELSEASIRFTDGANIDLAENSLIQVQVKNGKNTVDLAAGGLTLSGGDSSDSEITILVSGKNRVELGRGAVVSASADGGGKFTMQILEGEVTVNKETLAAGDSFSTVPLEARAAPLSPQPDVRVISGDGSVEMPFVWTRHNYSGGTRLDLAFDRRFGDIDRSLVIPDGRESAVLSLEPGIYWWRVYPDTGEAPRAAGKITVLPLLVPKPLSPPEGKTFYLDGSANTEVRFFWNSGDRPPEISVSGDYVMELSGSPGFDPPVFSARVEGAESGALVQDLEEGTWYWRVRHDFPGVEFPPAGSYFTVAAGTPPRTAVALFAEPPTPSPAPAAAAPVAAPDPVRAAAPPVTAPDPVRAAAPPPELLPPPSGMEPFDRYVLDAGAIQKSRRVLFGWNGVPGANSYIFTIFEETSGGPNFLFSVETARPSYVLDDLRLLERGSFVWRVEAVVKNEDRIDRRGTPGENRFIVDVPLPGDPKIKEPGVLYGR
ncbi:MAG: FecR domain-containing protein [Treponema sp.]|jgi:hypothetical protein|nr:FecR domain-containing protein [Treponema sp.]